MLFNFNFNFYFYRNDTYFYILLILPGYGTRTGYRVLLGDEIMKSRRVEKDLERLGEKGIE
jgi:hypothetical protein